MARHFDVAILGGGQAGIPLAHGLAAKGRTVALVERKYLGGSCVNFGCTPTKAAIASARVAHLARRASDFGLRIPTVEVDFPAVIARASDIAVQSRTGLDKGFAGIDNPKLFRAHGRLAGKTDRGFRVTCGDEEVTAAEIVLNTGNRTGIPPIQGLDAIDYLTAERWVHRTELPARLAMIGGGYVGLEMAQFYRRMGSEVTVWHHGPQVIAHEDEEISSAVQGFLEGEGIVFRLNAKVESVAQLNATHVFIATGRIPNTDDLGLETVGVECHAHGIVKVDKRLAASVKGIWAAGDIRGGPMFTHTSWDDFRILMSQMAGDGSRTTDRIVPYAVFTDPELGRVGMTESEARKSGLRFRVVRFEMKLNGKALELGEPEGFIKVIAEEGTERILGAALLCADAAELVHMYVDVMNAGASLKVIRDAVHIHPTLAEAVQSAVK